MLTHLVLTKPISHKAHDTVNNQEWPPSCGLLFAAFPGVTETPGNLCSTAG